MHCELASGHHRGAGVSLALAFREPGCSVSRGGPSSSVPGEVSFVPASQSAGEGACFWLPCSVFNCVFCMGLPCIAGFSLVASRGCCSLGWFSLLLWGTRASHVVTPGLHCSMARGVFLDRGSNPCLLHWQADFHPLRPQGSPVPILNDFPDTQWIGRARLSSVVV